MSKFKVGDRVKSKDGLLGHISDFLDGYIGVTHDNRDEMFHNLGGRCKPGHGWWYLPTSLTKVNMFKGNIK